VRRSSRSMWVRVCSEHYRLRTDHPQYALVGATEETQDPRSAVSGLRAHSPQGGQKLMAAARFGNLMFRWVRPPSGMGAECRRRAEAMEPELLGQMSTLKGSMDSYMQSNIPWTDRTRAARDGLKTSVGITGKEHRRWIHSQSFAQLWKPIMRMRRRLWQISRGVANGFCC
jgi:hypothetical protein